MDQLFGRFHSGARVGIVPIASPMINKPCFCTLSTVARFTCVVILRVTLLYSRVGLKKPTYS